MKHGPTLMEAAQMNALAYESHTEQVGDWKIVDRNENIGVDAWRHPDGWTYLALCGTRSCGRDVVDSVGVFLGRLPKKRIEQVNAYVRQAHNQALKDERLVVGGHSLGGLVATSVAAEFHLPALVQNAPGYFTQSPPPERCDRIIEIRTAGDVVSDWGSNCAYLITLRDPGWQRWGMNMITPLHAIELQNDLLRNTPDLACCTLVDARQNHLDINPDTSPTGNTLRSLLVSWRRLREHLELQAKPENAKHPTAGL